MSDVAFWSQISVDLNKYKNGDVAALRNAVSGGINCTCNDCMKLRKIRDEVLAERSGPAFRDLLKSEAAEVERDKMSLVVSAPGFYISNELSGQTSERFDKFFFSTTGKFSFLSLYKAARNAAAALEESAVMLFDDEIGSAISSSDKINKRYVATFKSTFVVGSISEVGEEVAVSVPSWGSLKNKMHLLIEACLEKAPAVAAAVDETPNFDEAYLVDGRFIPMFYFNNVTRIILNEDGSNERLLGIPGLPSVNKAKSTEYIMECARATQRAYEFGNDKQAVPFAYDIQTSSIVTGVYINDILHRIINANKEKFPAEVVATFAHVISPSEFAQAIRQDFDRNGAVEFEVTEFWPKNVTARWSEWSKFDAMNHSVTHPGYLAAVSVNGKPLIGERNGSSRGTIHIRYNPEMGRPWMIKSYWCQRLSSWSKHSHGVIDQLYDIWPLADWLSGPFAEKEKISLKSAPVIFSGNHMADRRKEALAKLKAKIN